MGYPVKVDLTASKCYRTQFVNLWALLSNIHLEEAVEDTIVWKLTKNGLYFAASVYKL
jgi:hypothetical protein